MMRKEWKSRKNKKIFDKQTIKNITQRAKGPGYDNREKKEDIDERKC